MATTAPSGSRGACGPPIETEAGWLLLYHGITDPGSIYSVGVALLDLDAKAANEKAKAIGGHAIAVQCDVTDAASIAKAACEVRRALGEGGLAGLVNNAGIAVPGPLEILPVEALRRHPYSSRPAVLSR